MVFARKASVPPGEKQPRPPWSELDGLQRLMLAGRRASLHSLPISLDSTLSICSTGPKDGTLVKGASAGVETEGGIETGHRYCQTLRSSVATPHSPHFLVVNVDI